MAKAIHADMYENWTDVSGVLVTDPRIVDDPEVIETITYKELRELSYICLLYTSKVHTTASIEVCGAEVQKGNAPTERKIQRMFRRPEVSRLIKKCNDFGADVYKRQELTLRRTA